MARRESQSWVTISNHCCSTWFAAKLWLSWEISKAERIKFKTLNICTFSNIITWYHIEYEGVILLIDLCKIALLLEKLLETEELLFWLLYFFHVSDFNGTWENLLENFTSFFVLLQHTLVLWTTLISNTDFFGERLQFLIIWETNVSQQRREKHSQAYSSY